MPAVEKALEKLDLTKAEIKIYLTLLNLGSSLAGVIARKSGIHRRNVYDALDRLTKKGLVGYVTKNNRKWYEATNPEKLLGLIKEREEALQAALPELKERFGLITQKQETLFFRGKAAIKSIFEDQLKEKKEVLILGASKGASQILEYYLPQYNRERIKKKVKLKILYSQKRTEHIPLAEIKYFPTFGSYENPASTNIYADKVAIIIWQKNPLAILIHEKAVAEAYKQYFKFMWQHASKR